MAVAGGDGDGLAGSVFHASEHPLIVAGRMHAFETVTDGKAVLDLDFHQPARRVEAHRVADIEAARGLRMAFQVVLVVGVVVALVKTIGVAAVGEAFEFAQQFRGESCLLYTSDAADE